MACMGLNQPAERQRIELFRRERLTKLKSLRAEVFYCYSVIASQFIAAGRIGLVLYLTRTWLLRSCTTMPTVLLRLLKKLDLMVPAELAVCSDARDILRDLNLLRGKNR